MPPTGEPNYEARPDIIITRYEANKKTGFVGIDENGDVPYLQTALNKLILVSLDGMSGVIPEYIIDANRAIKYDFTLNGGINYITFDNFKEGQEIICIVNNIDSGPALFSVSDILTIKWLNNDLPSITTNAKITFYKSNNIIYAQIQKPYIGSSGSGSGS